MIKKKYFLKDIEHEKEGVVRKIEGFTDESFIVIDIPSMREKLAFNSSLRGKDSGEVEDISMEQILSMLVEVRAETIEGDSVSDVDHLTVFPVEALFGFLGGILVNGYVPKKTKSV